MARVRELRATMMFQWRTDERIAQSAVDPEPERLPVEMKGVPAEERATGAAGCSVALLAREHPGGGATGCARRDGSPGCPGVCPVIPVPCTPRVGLPVGAIDLRRGCNTLGAQAESSRQKIPGLVISSCVAGAAVIRSKSSGGTHKGPARSRSDGSASASSGTPRCAPVLRYRRCVQRGATGA